MSKYLTTHEQYLNDLVKILSKSFKYVSVLGIDTTGKEYVVQKTGISINDPFWCERGFVVRIHNGINYTECSFNNLTRDSLDNIIIDIKNKELGNCCPITGEILTRENAAVDHKHITKKEIKNGLTGVEGKGLVRGVIHYQANSFLGKVEKAFIRNGCHKIGSKDIVAQLRAMADFLENPPIEQIYIHPNEKIKKKTLTKTEYKRICKYWFEIFPNKRKLPKYPKRKKYNMTPKWADWLNRANELAKPKSKRKVKRVKG